MRAALFRLCVVVAMWGLYVVSFVLPREDGRTWRRDFMAGFHRAREGNDPLRALEEAAARERRRRERE